MKRSKAHRHHTFVPIKKPTNTEDPRHTRDGIPPGAYKISDTHLAGPPESRGAYAQAKDTRNPANDGVPHSPCDTRNMRGGGLRHAGRGKKENKNGGRKKPAEKSGRPARSPLCDIAAGCYCFDVVAAKKSDREKADVKYWIWKSTALCREFDIFAEMFVGKWRTRFSNETVCAINVQWRIEMIVVIYDYYATIV